MCGHAWTGRMIAGLIARFLGVRLQPDSLPAADARATAIRTGEFSRLVSTAPLAEPGADEFHAQGTPNPGALRPLDVGRVQRVARDPLVEPEDTVLVVEVPEGVLFGAVLCRGRLDDRGRLEPLGLPVKTAPDRPGQDRGASDPGSGQRALHGRVAALLGDGELEGQPANAAPEGGVQVLDPRRVVLGQPELERRLELEELGVQEARGRDVAAREMLYELLRQLLALLDFDRRDQAGAHEGRNIIPHARVAALL